MDLLRVIAVRVAYGVLLLLAVLVLNFTLISVAPGDIADTIAGDMGGADAEIIEEIRQRYGLDQPFHVQLWRYMSGVFQFDLGYSYFFNTPVTTLVLERLPATLLLVFSAQILAIVLGTVLGVLAAKNPRGVLNAVVTFLALFGFAAPVFWTGILLIILFVSIFPIFPVAGMQNVTLEGGFFIKALDVLYHLFLPMITLASIYLALYSRLARASMQEVLGADYVRTARAKGVPEGTVLLQTRAEECRRPGDHRGRVAVCVRHFRCRGGRDRVLLARARHAGAAIDPRPRHADDHGDPVLLLAGGDRVQYPDRHRAAAGRSPDQGGVR